MTRIRVIRANPTKFWAGRSSGVPKNVPCPVCGRIAQVVVPNMVRRRSEYKHAQSRTRRETTWCYQPWPEEARI